MMEEKYNGAGQDWGKCSLWPSNFIDKNHCFSVCDRN